MYLTFYFCRFAISSENFVKEISQFLMLAFRNIQHFMVKMIWYYLSKIKPIWKRISNFGSWQKSADFFTNYGFWQRKIFYYKRDTHGSHYWSFLFQRLWVPCFLLGDIMVCFMVTRVTYRIRKNTITKIL